MGGVEFEGLNGEVRIPDDNEEESIEGIEGIEGSSGDGHNQNATVRVPTVLSRKNTMKMVRL